MAQRPGNQPLNLSPEATRALVVAYLRGESPATVGKQAGISASAVRRILIGLKVPLRPQRKRLPTLAPGAVTAILTAYQSGTATASELAETWRRPRAEIYRLFHAHGIPVRHPRARANPSAGPGRRASVPWRTPRKKD